MVDVASLEHFIGTVTWRSDTGIKLDTLPETQYLNKSSRNDLTMPPLGAKIDVGCQLYAGKYYVMELKTIAVAPAILPEDRRQVLIVRQNALAHAVAILVHNKGLTQDKVKLDDVRDLAALLEAWVLRGEG